MADHSVRWFKCVNQDKKRVWCSFDVDLAEQDMVGIYIIFRMDGTVVRIGIGNVQERVQSHRRDEEITGYAKKGKPLKLTWAMAPEDITRDQLRAIERYLADQLNPKVGRYPTNVEPESVNLPANLP